MFDELFNFHVLNAKPVYTLAECVSTQTITGDDADDNETLDATDPAEAVKEHFRDSVYLLDEHELAFLRFAAEQTESRAALQKAFSHQPFLTLSWNGYVYLFSWEDTYSLVFPEELIQIFREVTGEAGFAAANARNLEMLTYAKALLQLYGAYEIEHFVDVWNHHHKDKTTYKEAEDFLVKCAYYHSDYYFEEDFVVHDCLDEDEFDELWEQRNLRENIPYYLPTKSVIRELENRGYDDSKIPGEAEMNAFLAKYVEGEPELEDLQVEIACSCERLHNPSVIKEILKSAGAPVDDEAFCVGFDRLYNNLRGATHVWDLGGFTPYLFGEATGKTLPRFKLPGGKNRRKKQGKNLA